jgi:hypothetical protein
MHIVKSFLGHYTESKENFFILIIASLFDTILFYHRVQYLLFEECFTPEQIWIWFLLIAQIRIPNLLARQRPFLPQQFRNVQHRSLINIILLWFFEFMLSRIFLALFILWRLYDWGLLSFWSKFCKFLKVFKSFHCHEYIFFNSDLRIQSVSNKEVKYSQSYYNLRGNIRNNPFFCFIIILSISN